MCQTCLIGYVGYKNTRPSYLLRIRVSYLGTNSSCSRNAKHDANYYISGFKQCYIVGDCTGHI